MKRIAAIALMLYALVLADPILGDTQSAAVVGTAPAPAVSKKLAKVLAKGDGLTKATAYQVNSVEQEYEILSHFGLTPESQSLVMDKKPYDMIVASDPQSGEKRTLWFDVSKFFYSYGF